MRYDYCLYNTFDISSISVIQSIISVAISNKTSVYGEETAELTCDKTDGEVLNGDELGITLTKEEGASVGTYAITGTWSNRKYHVTFTNGTYTITARPAIVSRNMPNFTYDGKSHAPTATVNILIGTDTCTVTVSGSKRIDV